MYLSDEKNQATPARETVEVIKAIMKLKGYKIEEIKEIMKAKEEKKGIFNNKIFLEYVDEEKRNIKEEKELNKKFRKGEN